MKQFINELIRYRDYIFFTVKSQLKSEVSNTFLGYIWWLLDPLLNMTIYTILVTFIFEKNIPNFPVFIYCALLPWKWLTASITSSSKCISSNKSILNNISMPIGILSFIYCTINFIKYIFGLLILSLLLIIFKIEISWHILEFIFVTIVNYSFILAISLVVTHIGAFIKDLNYSLNHILRLWFYLSPGMYDLSFIQNECSLIWKLNPMSAIFTSYRNVIMYQKSPMYLELLIWFSISLLIINISNKVLTKNKGIYMKGA